MRPGNLTANSATLRKALSTLRARWEVTKNGWSDVVRAQFEENYLAPLERQCQSAAEHIDHLSHALAEIQRQCGPERESI